MMSTLKFELFLFCLVSQTFGQKICDYNERRDYTDGKCCTCISINSPCNTNDTINSIAIGFNCNEVDSDDECVLQTDEDIFNLRSRKKRSIRIRDKITIGNRHSDTCPDGYKHCCNKLPQGILAREAQKSFVAQDVITVNFAEICQGSALAAVQDFSEGVACGKRDSRVYYNHYNAKENERNQTTGKRIFIASGTLLDKDLVATVAHKMKDYTDKVDELVVRLGDWDLRNDFNNEFKPENGEEYPHIEIDVSCIKLHPKQDLDDTLANNIALIKLEFPKRKSPLAKPKDPKDVVILFSFPPGGSPEELATGLTEKFSSDTDCLYPQSYINTVCLPMSESQFANHQDECFIAAWGQDPYQQGGQREVHTRLLNRSECIKVMKPEFVKRGVIDWELQESEICAGPDETCRGEGGAPLVCLDKSRDQYFAVGLVNYGFGCGGNVPNIYVNLADPVVKDFIFKAIKEGDNFC